MICDGFEQAAPGGPPGADWTVELQNPQESLVVDDSRARSRQALAADSDRQRLRTRDPRHDARVSRSRKIRSTRARSSTRRRSPQSAHFTLVSGVGKLAGASEKTYVRLGGQFGILMANYYGFNAADQPQYSSSTPGNYSDGVQMPRERWACVEVGYLGTAHELRIWLDDAEITRLKVTNWNPLPPNPAWSPAYERVEIGFEAYGGQGEIDIWYDEIAIGDHRIGCPK